MIAFGFGAFIEGAAGFGTPVAVAAAMLTGLGFSPFYAAGICLLANTAPVAFGSIAIPITTLAVTTGLPLDQLSAAVGRICAPVSLFVPAYLILVMAGWKGLKSVLPAAALCGFSFAAVQFLVSNFINPQLTDILASLAAMGSLVIFCRSGARPPRTTHHTGREIFMAWMPYLLLVVFVLLWGYKPIQTALNSYQPSDQLAGAAQHHRAHGSRGRGTLSVRGDLQLRVAFGIRHGVPVRGHPERPGVGAEAADSVWEFWRTRASNWRWRS